MQPGTPRDRRLVGWNGIRLRVPVNWDARVLGLRHLVFEHDFRPVLELRWQASVDRSHERLVRQLGVQLGRPVAEESLPASFRQQGSPFFSSSWFGDEDGRILGGAASCPSCHTTALVRLHGTKGRFLEEVGASLASLRCHGQPGILWSMHRLNYTLAPSMILKDYVFGAGLNRLVFRDGDLQLQLCSLGPADSRLSGQSLEEILVALCGAADLEMVAGEDDRCREGSRSPALARQLLYRLRRERPFVRARIRHDLASNRLVAVVCSSRRQVPVEMLNALWPADEDLR